MFKFDKLTANEEQAFELLAEGNYEFKVMEAKESFSKSGNSMLTLSLLILDHYGNAHVLKDWLVAANHAMCKKKVRDFCFSINNPDLYEAGNLLETDLENKTGKCYVGIELDTKGIQRNKIMNYVYGSSENQKQGEAVRGMPLIPESELEDAIPF